MICPHKMMVLSKSHRLTLELTGLFEYGLLIGFRLQVKAIWQACGQEMESLMARRKKTQPINKRTAGCVFRNPELNSAGRIIDECGCKGMAVGGAVVSEKHANFIINTGEARSRDVLELIERVRERVHKATGVALALEIAVVDPWGKIKRDE